MQKYVLLFVSSTSTLSSVLAAVNAQRTVRQVRSQVRLNIHITLITTSVSDVYKRQVAGEAAGGIHGRNRLMGNSLLDVIVFGRNAGKKAAAKCKNVELGEMNLDHIYKYADELDKAGVHTDKVSPLPVSYTHLDVYKRQL